MTGQRLPDGFEPTKDWLAKLGASRLEDLSGGYGKDSSGAWCVVTPNGRYGSVAKHTVVEHEDRTITVSPSILVYATPPVVYTPEDRARVVELAGEEYAQKWEKGFPEYHGFLERGVWRSC
jgi:hypothetical protein